MSGPKVVRIVTVEEVREICRGHLARLDAAVARWEQVCRRNDTVSADDVKAVHARRADIAALMAKERYLDLQKRAPDEIQWLAADLERRIEKAAQQVVDAGVRARRRADLATELLRRSNVPDNVRRGLQAIARGDDVDGPGAEAVIGEALRSTASAPAAQETDAALQALAQRLAAGLSSESLDDWLRVHRADADESATMADKIESAIATLALTGEQQQAAALSARYKLILAEPASSARRMRTDTLLIEVARTLEAQRESSRRLASLELVLAEAKAVLGDAHAALIADAQGIVDFKDAAAADAHGARLVEAIEVKRKAAAAAARRQAVLTALAAAGYEAREGMETGQPVDGRLVLRRAANPEMGVEIAGGTASARLQMRPVRFAAPGSASDTAEDRDIETIWCGDFDTLRDSLRKLEADVAIERATPVGTTAVMVVEDAASSASRRAETPVVRRTGKT